MSNRKKPNNLRTAILLFSVAFAFFVAVFIKQTWLR
ncbi:cytochrome oxidase small assembly protein [Undibacterium sp. Di27W]